MARTTVALMTEPHRMAWQQLGPVARILLASDGTLTELLEALAAEPVAVSKLREARVMATPEVHSLAVDADDWLIERIVLLHGRRTARPLVHARVLVVANRLSTPFREDLLGSDAPIGRLWRRHRVELFREPLDRSRGEAGPLAALFGCAASALVWSRTSRVQERGRPVMLITETFAPDLVEGGTV